MVATLAQAQADLAPYIERLRRCVETAIKEFQADQGRFVYRLESRTQANILRDYIVSNIKAEFPDDEPDVRHSSRRGLFLLTIQNRYFLRFKLLDRRLKSRNNPTQLSLDYLLQRPLELFPSLEPATNLNVGYQRGLTLSTSTVWITCPDGGVLDWKWKITEDDEPIQLQSHDKAEKPAREEPRKRVRPKPVKKADDVSD